MNEILTHLTSGTLSVSGRLVDASNATLFAQCEFEGETIDVIYKPVAGERPLWDFPDGNLAQREFAAFLISSYAEWEIVPPTVLREGPFGIGMVQQWIEIDDTIDLALFYREDHAGLRKMAIFDAVINNTDRKIGHLLPSKSGHLYGCDHGVTFHEEYKLRTVLWQWADQPLTHDEILELRELKSVIVSRRERLFSLITESEYNALLSRIDDLVESGVFPSPSEEWPAVPWPPF